MHLMHTHTSITHCTNKPTSRLFEQFAYSAPRHCLAIILTPPIHLQMVQTSLQNCLSLNSPLSSLSLHLTMNCVGGNQGQPSSLAAGEDMQRSAVDHHHGEASFHFLWRPDKCHVSSVTPDDRGEIWTNKGTATHQHQESLLWGTQTYVIYIKKPKTDFPMKVISHPSSIWYLSNRMH